MTNILIELKDISKSFNGVPVLCGVNLKIREGEITSLIGKSGEGKSVLLKIITGLMEPDSGDILYDGKSLSGMNKKELRWVKSKFSYMFQGSALFDSMTVFENIALPLVERGKISKKDLEAKVHEKMDKLELSGMDDKYPSQISGGMTKRVALARALIMDPEIVFFDEPTTGLDPVRKNAVHSMISEYRDKFGFTGVIVSHDIPDVFYIAQYVIMINDGKVIFSGASDEILNTSDNYIREFVHGPETKTDHLTGLVHGMHGRVRFDMEMQRAKNDSHSFALGLITLENMVEINERLGHISGQTFLKNFIKKLRQQLRATDVCSRFGLNQLMIFMLNADYNKAVSICEKVATRMKGDNDFGVIVPEDLKFAFSVGIVEASEESRVDDLIDKAERKENVIYEFFVA